MLSKVSRLGWFRLDLGIVFDCTSVGALYRS
jgi:hypothetical protein